MAVIQTHVNVTADNKILTCKVRIRVVRSWLLGGYGVVGINFEMNRIEKWIFVLLMRACVLACASSERAFKLINI